MRSIQGNCSRERRIAQGKRGCSRLTSFEEIPVVSGAHACRQFECTAEMALIRKSGFGGNLSEWLIAGAELSDGILDSKPPHVFTDCASVELAEYSGQVNHMHVGNSGDSAQREFVNCTFTEQFLHAEKPRRRLVVMPLELPTSGISKNLKHQSFDDQRGGLVKSPELRVKTFSQPGNRPPDQLEGFF